LPEADGGTQATALPCPLLGERLSSQQLRMRIGIDIGSTKIEASVG
jgi:hypothetical protein